MVLTFIADIVLDVTYWTSKKVYNAGYWLVWGTPKSEVELLIQKQNETIQLLNENVLKLNQKIDFLAEDSKTVSLSK